MKIVNKYGVIQVVLAYSVLWLAKILELVTKEFSKDVFFISFMLSLIFVTDAKMKYKNKLVKLSYWIIFILFILYCVVILI